MDSRFHIGIILSSAMPLDHRRYTPGREQFITTSIYRRAQLFPSDRLARDFVDVLRKWRAELKFPLIGWVLMPEHFHSMFTPKRSARKNSITCTTIR